MKPEKWMVRGGLILIFWGICGLGILTDKVGAEDSGTAVTQENNKSDTDKSTPEKNLLPGKRRIMGASSLIGRALYAFEELGTNGKSCKSCHGQGTDTKGGPWKRKEGDTYMNGKMSLAKAINFCVTSHQGGTALQSSGMEMKSLVLYVSSLQK